MKDELWLKRMKERLDDYTEPVPASAWERLEAELSPQVTPVSSKRLPLYRRWGAVAAAAVLLLAVSTVSLWFLQTPMSEEIRTCSEPVVADALKLIPAQEAPLADETPAFVSPSYPVTLARVRQQPVVREVGETPVLTADSVCVPSAETPESETAPKEAEKPSSHTQPQRRRPSSRDKYHLPATVRKDPSDGRWSFALAMGHTGGLSSANPGGNALLMQSPGIYPQGDGRLDLSATSNGVVIIPEGQEVVFRDGVPYLQGRSKQVSSVHHKQPVSVGFLVRKQLPKGFSVETGLTYTFLASDVTLVGGAELKQKLHYVGLPLRANWSFWQTDRFELYVSAGGAMEKCVYGKWGSETQTVKPLQFSVMGALGAQLNLSRRMGLYVEPGVTYYFDDHSRVQTLRKETPCNFTLQGGLRFTY